jgi:hypothetical protein
VVAVRSTPFNTAANLFSASSSSVQQPRRHHDPKGRRRRCNEMRDDCPVNLVITPSPLPAVLTAAGITTTFPLCGSASVTTPCFYGCHLYRRCVRGRSNLGAGVGNGMCMVQNVSWEHKLCRSLRGRRRRRGRSLHRSTLPQLLRSIGNARLLMTLPLTRMSTIIAYQVHALFHVLRVSTYCHVRHCQCHQPYLQPLI